MANKSGKQLIEESRAVRWMKLANIAPLSESFVKDTFGKQEESEEVDEILTQNQARARGDTDRLNESPIPAVAAEGDEEMPPEAPVEEPPMDGGEMGGESMEGDVEAFLSQVADALTAYSGVPVDVSSDAGGAEGGEEMPPDMGGEEVPAEEPAMEEGEGAEEVAEGEEPEALQEEQSPVGAKTTSSSMNNPPTPKSTKQADPGKPKDPMKGEVRVKGAEKPTQMESDSYYGSKGHQWKALEERLMKRVYERLISDLKEAKVRKESAAKKNESLVAPASPANVPAKRVAAKPSVAAKPTMKPVAKPVAAKPAVKPVVQAKPAARPAPAVAETKTPSKK